MRKDPRREPASEVLLIPIEQLRALDYDGIAEKLCSVRGFGKVAWTR